MIQRGLQVIFEREGREPLDKKESGSKSDMLVPVPKEKISTALIRMLSCPVYGTMPYPYTTTSSTSTTTISLANSAQYIRVRLD